MSINVPTWYVQQYSTNLDMLLQQKGSRLTDSVMHGSYVGEQGSPVDQVAAVEATEVTDRFAPMARIDAATDRRWVFPSDFDLPQLIDSFDKLRLITDPNSVYTTNGVYAMGRAKDDVIITAYFADAKTGKSGGTTTTFATEGQNVAVAFGAAGNVGLTVAKLLEAERLLMAAEVDLDNDPVFCIGTSNQHDDLLHEIQIINKDFNNTAVLVKGKISSWGIFNFKFTERLDVDGSTFRRVPVYAKSGMHLGMWNDIKTSVSKRNDLRGEPWQVYAYGSFGATRVEGLKMVEVKCAE